MAVLQRKRVHKKIRSLGAGFIFATNFCGFKKVTLLNEEVPLFLLKEDTNLNNLSSWNYRLESSYLGDFKLYKRCVNT